MRSLRLAVCLLLLPAIAHSATPVISAEKSKIRTPRTDIGKQYDQSTRCMALNVYFESRNQSEAGQLAVLQVVLNRVRHIEFPDSICDVVYQKHQFSWSNDGKSDVPKEIPVYSSLLKAATKLVTVYQHINGLDGALYYHRNDVHPPWADVFERLAVIGDHIFYK